MLKCYRDGKHNVIIAVHHTGLILFILDNGKQLLCHTEKAQMKCRIRGHFIRVFTVCQDKFCRDIDTS